MSKFFYFLKSVSREILTFLISVILLAATFLPINNPPLQFFLRLSISFVGLLVIINWRLREKDFYFISLDRGKDKDDWIGIGVFDFSRTTQSFLVGHNDPGFLYSRCLTWSDYKLKFEFKIAKKCLGVIMRASNLSNYVMLQITESGIRPHIRINSAWRVWESEEEKLNFKTKLELDKWYKCQISCDKETILIRIDEEKSMIFDRQWKLPKGLLLFQFKKDKIDLEIPFAINLEYGTFGFRNSGDEEGLVRNVLIEKI